MIVEYRTASIGMEVVKTQPARVLAASGAARRQCNKFGRRKINLCPTMHGRDSGQAGI
jgi:hypothetical protein